MIMILIDKVNLYLMPIATLFFCMYLSVKKLFLLFGRKNADYIPRVVYVESIHTRTGTLILSV